MSMNIYAKEGTKVRVLFDENGIMNGTDSDKEHAERHLKALSSYTIDHTEVSSWHTEVYLKEIPNIPFNSVHFEEFKLGNTVNEEHKLIDDTNELIAIFDGWDLVEEDNAQAFEKNGRWLYHYQLNYHADWNHLINVWYKFRDLRFGEFGKLEFEHSELNQLIAHEICYGNRDTALKSMVLGIKWYNSINKTNG